MEAAKCIINSALVGFSTAKFGPFTICSSTAYGTKRHGPLSVPVSSGARVGQVWFSLIYPMGGRPCIQNSLNLPQGGSVNSTTFPLPGASGGPFLLFWEVRQFNYFSSWGDSFWGSANCSSWRTLSSKANFPLGPFWSIFLTPFFLFNGHVLLFCSLFFIVKEPISSCMFVYCSTVPVIPCMLRPSQE